MCGIAGIFDKNSEDLSEDIQQMTDVLKHRGPDGQGVWNNREDGIWLGHRRLSILDLSENGKQPMHYLNRYTITFNGEIYNYIEIKKELVESGYHFHSETDTEVLLALYDYRGNKCLEYLDGMFAFAIWDSQLKKLFCARDRFGEKPFYYYYKNNRFYFSSEMKALWKVGVPKKLKPTRVADFLTNSRIFDINDPSGTFYEDIYQLQNGFYLELDSHSFRINLNRYYQLKAIKNSTISWEEAKETFFKLFKSSIEKRLRSDVPVGTGLSGGMDSSSIVAMISTINSGKVTQNTFSARFEGFEKDEGKFINAVLERYPNIKHYNVWPTREDFEDVVDKMVYHQEEPFGSASIYAQWKVMETVGNTDVKVLLDGQGADETLAGYLYYYSRKLYYLFNTDHSTYKSERNGYYHLRKSKVPFQNLESTKTKIGGWLKRRINYKIKKIVDLDELLLADSFKGSLQELLRYGDRNSMAHSVEARAPFLSHHLVEFVFSLPDEFKLYKGWTKYLLRSSMENYLPEDIIWRIDKIAYETPQADWLKKSKQSINQNKVKQYLNDSGIIDNHLLTDNSSNWKLFVLSRFIK